MKHIIMGTAGHIDHGKTKLIKALTGVDCDTHKEEKRRGITINLGFTHLPLSTGDRIGIIDVPGHRNFVHTMVGGASGIDFVLLVIAADSGVMPQTREHLQIMSVLGIRHGLTAITKTDLVDPDIANLAEAEIKELVTGTFLEGQPIVRVSSVTGEGVNQLKESIDQIALQTPNRPTGEVFRLFIDRIFIVKGFGTVVTGTVTSGVLRAGDKAYLLPREKKLRVRRLERFGEETEEVTAGDRASINLAGFDQEDFRKGMIISDRILRPTEMVDARLSLFQHSWSFNRLWNQVIFHLGTYEHQARVHLIDCNRLIGDETALVQIHLDAPCNIQLGDRFVIRNTSSDTTLGGGAIIDAFPLHHRRRPETLVTGMAKIAGGKLHEIIASEVRKHVGVITCREIADLLNVSHEKILEAVSGSLPEGIISYAQMDNAYLITEREHDGLQKQLLENIAAYHIQNPFSRKGLSTEELVSLTRIERGSQGAVLVLMMLEALEKEDKLKLVDHTWTLFEDPTTLGPEQSNQVIYVENLLKSYGMKTPFMSELISNTESHDIDEQKLRNILHYLVEEQKAYFIDGSYLHSSIVERCRGQLLNTLSNSQQKVITVAEFRDLVAGNRKICLLLLNIYDREGFIQRSGDLRVITKKGMEKLEKERI